MQAQIVDPNVIYPNAYKTTCFLKNVVTAPNIFVGDYTYYDDPVDPTAFERSNVLFNWPEFGDKLVIGKFCALASGVQFIMGSANHRMCSASTYPFAVMGQAWADCVPAHLSQLPHKGDTVVGNDVWIGRGSVILPGVHIGDGAIVAAQSVVASDVAPYTIVGGNPARCIRKRFSDAFIDLLRAVCWWDAPPEVLPTLLPLLCEPDLAKAEAGLRAYLAGRDAPCPAQPVC